MPIVTPAESMHIIVLCKRRYTGKDLLAERYGRLWEIPAQLRAMGHAVHGIAAAYRQSPAVAAEGWRSVSALPHPVFLRRAWRRALPSARPDVIWASADAAHLVAACALGRELGVPVVLDFYDDYEAFGLTRWTALAGALRRATTTVPAVTAVGHRLQQSLVERGAAAAAVHVLPNGVPAAFAPSMDRSQGRRALGLPAAGRLFGTAGALDASRGIQDLVAAARLLAGEARLVIAGPGARRALGPLPADAIDLGVIAQSQVGALYRALDVGVVCNRDSAFGRHCHPMKLVEMVACGLPLVAADVGETACLLAERPDATYPPGDAALLAERVRAMLRRPAPLPGALARPWASRASELEAILRDVVAGSNRCAPARAASSVSP